MRFWQFKVPMTLWANDGTGEYENLSTGSIFKQYVAQNRNQLGNNVGEIVFYYNSKKSKKYGVGIYLVCKIHSKIDNEDCIELEVIKDLRDNPFDYSNDFLEMHEYYNTTKIRSRAQPKEQILATYNPEKLFDMIMNSEGFLSTEELSQKEAEKIFEGAKTEIIVNAYERSPIARKKCIEHYGTSCVICGFNFEDVYGEIGKDFIHVHHIKPLSEINSSYEVDPIKDLRPVCPNCHAMIHKKRPALSIEEIKDMMD